MNTERKKDGSQEILELDDITFFYDDLSVLEGISLQVEDGETIGVAGRNGSGKSTLMKICVKEMIPDSGQVMFHGSENEISYLPQNIQFPNSLTAGEVIEFYRHIRPDCAKKKNVIDSLLNISSFSRRRLSQLSGGQQRRVAVYISLSKKAELYCLDEPFAGLSSETANELCDYLCSWDDTVIFSSHLERMMNMAVDRCFRIRDGCLSVADQMNKFTSGVPGSIS